MIIIKIHLEGIFVPQDEYKYRQGRGETIVF